MDNKLEDVLYTVVAMICLTWAAIVVADSYAPKQPKKQPPIEEIVEINKIDNKYHDGESI